MKRFQNLSQTKFALIITCIYAVVLVIAMAHHELWRDEVQTWMISKASIWPWDIFKHSRYEGHPQLWFIIVWPFARLFDNPEWIKVPHFVIAIATTFIIARYAPFPRWSIVLLLFGYYFLYEYGVLSRNYRIGILGMVSFLACYGHAIKKPWIALVLLSITVWSNVFGALVAMMLAGFYLTDVVAAIRSGQTTRGYKWQVCVSAGLFLFSFLVMASVIKPPVDNSFGRWNFTTDWENLKVVVIGYLKAIVPISKDVMGFWNNSVFEGAGMIYLSIALIAIVVALFYKYPRYAFWVASTIAVVVFFQHVKYLGFLRHSGHYWLALVFFIWLLAREKGWLAIYKPLRVVFGLLLAVHLYASVMAVGKDFSYTFSDGKGTANFIQSKGWENRTVIGYPDYCASIVSAYLNRPIYYIETRETGTYLIWSGERYRNNLDEYLLGEQAYLQGHPDNYIVVSLFSLSERFPWLKEVYHSKRTIVWDENFYVYEVMPAQ